MGLFGLPKATAGGGLRGLPPLLLNARPPALRQFIGGGASPTLQTLPLTGNLIIVTGTSIQVGDFTVSGAGATWTRLGRVSLSGGGGGAQVEVQAWVGKVGSSPSTSISAAWVNVCTAFAMEIDCEGFDGAVAAATTTSANGAVMEMPVISGLGRAASNRRAIYFYSIGGRGSPQIVPTHRSPVNPWFSYYGGTDPRVGFGLWRFQPGVSMLGPSVSSSGNLAGAIEAVIV